MKRLVIFFVLFGGGLSLLYYLSQRQKEAKRERLDSGQEQLVKGPRNEQPPFTPIPAESEPETTVKNQDSGNAGDQGIPFIIRGELSFSVREDTEPHNLVYAADFDDVRPRGEDHYDVTGLTIRFFDTETEELGTTFKAKKALVRIERGREGYAIGRTERVQLTDVTVTLHRGSPMAPLTVELPAAELDIDNGSLYSDESVELSGDGITGEGIGLVLLERGKSLEIVRKGVLTLQADESTQFELTAAEDSSIALNRLQVRDDLERIEVRLPAGGKLVASGETPFEVRADELVLDGRVMYVETKTPQSTTRRRQFRAEHADLLGNAEVRRDKQNTTSDQGEIFFDALGEFRRMRMEDRPVVRGVLEMTSGDPQVTGPVSFELSGQGPMEVTYNATSPAADFNMQGPSQISAADLDLQLTAEAGIGGNFWGRGLADASLRGAVTGKFEGKSFEGSDLTIRGRRSEDGDQHLFFETKQPAHLWGASPAGDIVDLRSGQILNLTLDRGTVDVVLAQVVKIAWEGEQGWTANMGEVHDLNLETGVFRATGGVDYSGPLGTGSAARAIGHSFEHLEMFGKEGAPAVYNIDPATSENLERGLLRALHLDLHTDKAVAKGGVELRFIGQAMKEEIDCGQFTLTLLEERIEGKPTPFEFEAQDVARALIVSGTSQSTLVANSITGSGSLTRFPDDKTRSAFDLGELQAKGKVRVDYDGEAGTFSARGGRVTWSGDGRGRLEAPAGDRVEARGRFQDKGLPYLLTAAWIEYGEQEIEALFPEITLDRPAALPLLLSGRGGTELYEGSADWLTSDLAGLLLAGNAHFAGKTKDGKQLDLDAGSMHLTRTPDTRQQSAGVDEVVAWDGFKLQLEDDLIGTGEILQAGYQVLRMEGRPARLDVHGFAWEASNIVYDVPRVLVTTDQGTLYGARGSGAEGWVVNYESLQPFEGEDSTMMVMRNVTINSGERQIRADWATFWLDREEWLRRTKKWIDDEAPAQPMAPPGPEPSPKGNQAPTLFGRFDSTALSKVLTELYLEGGVEIMENGKRRAQMEAVYVDMVDGHGWIQDGEFFMNVKVGHLRTNLIVRAAWLRHSSDGSLSADQAEVTACSHAVPHYYIETKNLRMEPTEDSSTGWDILMKDNALVFDNGITLPLPRVHYQSDGKGRPTLGVLRFGDSARYGTFVEASADVDVGESLSEVMGPILNADPSEIDGRYRLRASYFASRGLLLEQRFRMTAADHFWMNMTLNGLHDSGQDRGLLRSNGPGDNGFRWLLATQARYSLEKEEWFDFSLANQTDAGFQAEFMEGQFVRFERRDNFLRWRKAQGEHYYSVNLRYRIDDFRNEAERLPDIGYVRGLTPIAELWGQPVLYTAAADAAYLRLRQAQGNVVSPFDPTFDPSLGNREILRADTRHRIETPLSPGLLGLRVSPYAELIGTAWSEGVNDQDTPTRGAAIAGIEAQSTLYRTWSHGVVNSVTPFAGVHGDFASFQQGGVPVQIDEVDGSVEGRFLDLGLRSRWRQPGGARYLDTSVRATHAAHVGPDQEAGWAPIQVLGELLAVYNGIPYAVTHDAKYDPDDGDTTHSTTSLSVLPFNDLGLEVGFNRGLDQQRNVLFNTVDFGAHWNATPKWQFEGRQSISRLDNSALASDFLLRRLGHDFIFDLGVSFRSGQGGSTLSFRYRPRLGWHEPVFGRMQALQQARL